VIRVLAVTGILLVAAGMGLPPGVSAQTPQQGEAVGLLFFLGASRPGGPANARTLVQKPKLGVAASPKAANRIAEQKPPLVKEESVLARTGGGAPVSIPRPVSTPRRVERPSERLDSTVLRVTSDQKNGLKLDRPVELADRELARHE
jgi:hypothetical protein